MNRVDWQGERFDKHSYSARYDTIERKSVFVFPVLQILEREMS